jgi:predicted DNA-binding transcriptional regulator AlpA
MNGRTKAAQQLAFQRFARNFWSRKGVAFATATPLEPIDVLDIEAIAKRSGLAVKSLHIYSRRDGFPSPVARTGRRLFWARDEIENWIKNRACDAAST